MNLYRIEELFPNGDVEKVEDLKKDNDNQAEKYFYSFNKKMNEGKYSRSFNLVFLGGGVFKYLIQN